MDEPCMPRVCYVKKTRARSNSNFVVAWVLRCLDFDSPTYVWFIGVVSKTWTIVCLGSSI
jgi:hypothetical protein